MMSCGVQLLHGAKHQYRISWYLAKAHFLILTSRLVLTPSPTLALLLKLVDTALQNTSTKLMHCRSYFSSKLERVLVRGKLAFIS